MAKEEERSGDTVTQHPTDNDRAEACGRDSVFLNLLAFAIKAILLQPRLINGLNNLSRWGTY